MTKWEYLFIDSKEIQAKSKEFGKNWRDAFREGINSLGAEGWELVTAEDSRFIFKRPLNA
jgi:hypothetical protein